MGKLNFWQWLGVVLLIVGIVWWILRESPDKKQPAPNPNPAPSQTTGGFSRPPTQPAAPPATQPGG